MKKILSLLLICVLALTVSACGADNKSTTGAANNNSSEAETFASNENAQLFFNKIIENKNLLDPIFRSVGSAWRAAETKAGATVTDVNKAINDALSAHSDSIATINENDLSLGELYSLATKTPASTNIDEVMTAYVSYEEAVLNSNASTNPGGYNDASLAKNSLDQALRNLRTVLGS